MSTERSTYVDRLPETLTLKSRDGQEFEVKKEAALQMGIVRGMFGVLDEDPDDVISIEEVDGTILQKVIDFCCFQVRRKMEDMSAEEVQDWERNYTRTDTGTLLKILRAARLLVVDDLIDLTCEAGKAFMDRVRRRARRRD